MIEFTRANGCNIVLMEVPGRLECRDMVLRTVSAACKLIMPDTFSRESRGSEFTAHVVSAVGEAYNNIVLHGYAGRDPDPIQMQIENCPEWMRITIKDTGVSFDPSQALPPDLEMLPESGLGVFIMRSFVDEITYVAGSPNVLTLVKRLDGGDQSGSNATRLPESGQD
jgi:serine/threonine-protein kinase RsbW